MRGPAATAASMAGGHRLSPGLFIAAAAEIGVAVTVAMIVLNVGHTQAMHPQSPVGFHWPVKTTAIAALTAGMLIWWLSGRARRPAVAAAAGLALLTASEPVRAMVLESHLVAMAVLETVFVAVPLLLIGALRYRRPTAALGSSRPRVAGLTVAVVVNSALLIGLHLPAVHDRGAHLNTVPVWLHLLVFAVGLGYWAAVLLTGGRVSPAVRRGALIIGQEVAAILGLAVLLRPATLIEHANPLGLSPMLDQRLGGVLMLITCATVTLPINNRLSQEHARTEHHGH